MKTKQLFLNALLITGLTAGSKVLGLIRESSLAAYFGASSYTDAYKVAFALPDVFFALLTAAIVQTFIPVYNDKLKQNNPQESKKFLNNMFTITAILSVVIVSILMLIAPFIVKVMAPGLDTETQMLSAKLSRIILPAVIFLIITNLASGYLQSHNRFVSPAMTWYPHNIIIIVSIIFFHKYGIVAVAAGSAISFIGMFLIQVPSLKEIGFSYKPVLDLKDEGIQTVGRLVGPVLISSAFNQLFSIINKMLASGLDDGSISAMDYAYRLISLVTTIFIISMSTALYPTMAQLSDDIPKFAKAVGKVLRFAFILTLPMGVGLVMLRIPIVELVYQRGAFTPEDTQKTAFALLGLTIGVIGYAYRELLNKAFYALKDTNTAMKNGLIAISLNIIFNIVLSRFMGIGGLTLGFSLAAIVSSVMLLIRIRKKIGSIHEKWILSGILKAIIASVVMGLVIFATEYFVVDMLHFTGSFALRALNIIIAVTIGAVVYLGLLFVLKVEEVSEIFSMITKKIKILRIGATVKSTE